MLDMMQRVNWDEYLSVLSQGYPPVGFQLVAVNAALVVMLFLLRARKRTKQLAPARMLQLLFVLGNIGIISFGSWLSI